MNLLRFRKIAFALAIVLVGCAHSFATSELPNTMEAMLVFHGSAMMLDWLLLWLVAPMLLQGTVLDWSQWALVSCMIGNALGWILYISYVTPSIYNTYMWALAIVQLASLFIPDCTDEDNTSDRSWFDMVRHRNIGGNSNNT